MEMKTIMIRLRKNNVLPTILRLLLGIFLLNTVTNIAIAAEVLGTGTIPPSEMVNKELELIYQSGADSITIGGTDIAPWTEAKVLMKANRDAKLDLELKAMNYSLYLQGLERDKDGISLKNTPQAEIVANHITKGGYCASSSTSEARFQCQTDALLQHGDINAASLLSGFRYDNAREIAARLFINNLVNPFPTEELLDPKVLQDPTSAVNSKIIAEALAEQAVLSTAREALASVFAKRKPVDGIQGSDSFMQIMEREASKDFLNAAWQAQMKKLYVEAIAKGKPEVAILYQNAMREAYTTFLLYQTYREIEESKVLMAALLAITERQQKAATAVVRSATSGANISTPTTPKG